MNKKVQIGGAAVLIIAATLVLIFRGEGSRPEFRTEAVARGSIQATVTATGTVNPVTTVLVGTQVSGTIRDLYVDFNSPVKKGQLIARIDPEIFEAQTAQAKASADKADAALREAERTLSRSRALSEKNLIARSELDTAETNFDSARAQADLAAAALKSAETNLRYTKILSPVDGVVISRNVDVGQTVAASFQTPTLFTIAQDLTKMQIDANVDESDIGKVAVGQNVEFTVDAYPETPFTGKVRQIRRAPITVQNVVTYDVVVRVNNPGLRLMPGMTANVSIILLTKEDVIRIPNAALRFKPDKGKGIEQQKGPGVWVLDKGKQKRIPVQTGISDGSFTELVSGELGEGREVITEAVTKAKQQSSTPSGPRMF